MYIVIGGYLRILCAASFQSCSTLSRDRLPTVYLSVADITHPELFACGRRT